MIPTQMGYSFNDLKEKDIILYGAGKRSKRMILTYISYNIKISYVSYSAAKEEKEYYENIPVLSYSNMLLFCAEKTNVVIQIASSFEVDIVEQLKTDGIKCPILVYNDFLFLIRNKKLNYLLKMGNNYRRQCLEDYAKNFKYFSRNLAWQQLDPYNLEEDVLNIILGCPKTGTTTVNESLCHCKKIISPIYISYSMNLMSDEYKDLILKSKKRIITGVREPISQMLSMLFFLWYTRESLFDTTEKFPNITDCQYWFDQHFIKKTQDDEENVFDIFCRIMCTNCNILDFFEKDFYNLTKIDIYKHKFNKEEGYTTFKENQTEIFIYRIDKLNDLSEEIGNFFGEDPINIISANQSKDRIYKALYKEALKKIRIPRKFIDQCYDSKIIKWCYTESEIQTFYKKWENNIMIGE